MLGRGLAVAGLLAPAASELRLARAERPLTDRWSGVPVARRGSTRLGISFRPLQAEALGLDPRATLQELLGHPFQMIRLAAYWDRLEPEAGRFCADDLDWQLADAEQAGKQVIMCVGAVKAFGYPELFVPEHHLDVPLREGSLVEPATHPALLDAATAFVTRVVRRYRDRSVIVAWQVEHEAVDPLGMEHSWRLATPFVRREVEAVRRADPSRPIMMNGFLPTSLPVRVQQWWRTRYQGDSLSVAEHLADIVGIDFYPRHALIRMGAMTLYLDGSQRRWQQRRRKRLFAGAGARRHQVMISEGQAEPWEATTVPPSHPDRAMYSCPPEQLIDTYNQCLGWGGDAGSDPWAYLFWGAEYWVRRQQDGDRRYIDAFARVLTESSPGPLAVVDDHGAGAHQDDEQSRHNGEIES